MRIRTPEQELHPEDQDQRVLVALIDFIKDEFAGVNTNMEAMRLIMTMIGNLSEDERKTKSRVDLLLLVSKKIHDFVVEQKETKKKERERESYMVIRLKNAWTWA